MFVLALGGSRMAVCQDVPREGLILWLDASDLGALAEEVPVAEWQDKSPLKNDLAQDEAKRRPVFRPAGLNDRPVVRFQGGQLLDREHFTGLATGDQQFHVLIVMRAPGGSAHTAQRLFDLQSREATAGAAAKRAGFWMGYQAGRGKLRLGINQGDEGEAPAVAWDEAPHLIEAVYTGEQTFALYQDGTRQQQAMFNGTHFLGFQPHVTLAIGQHFGLEENVSTYYEGDLAEVLVYARPLTASERFQIGSYLTEKYQLSAVFRPIPQFERDVLPILARHCHHCHGEETREAELDLRTVSSMLTGGKAGPVIVRGFPDRSELIAMLETGQMPPEGESPLSQDQIRTLRDWVEADAPARERIVVVTPATRINAEQRAHWAYQKLVRHTPPEVLDKARVTNEIDRFVLAKLEAQGLTLSAEADRATLIRRLYFDLIGLPPSPVEIDAFVADNQEGAYERLVDRLLASEHFGERWGRYWLDVAGYVDVYGSDNDFAIIKPLEGKWRYRDYVVRSFNQDKPFDQFLLEQLAGDELSDWQGADRWTPDMLEALTATGFLLCANDDTDQNELNTPDIRHHVLQRTTEVVASNLLAMTLMCAKCHDHKYEAISQYDYYQLEAAFAGAFNVRHWIVSNAKGRPNVSDRERAEIDAQLNGAIDPRSYRLPARQEEILGGIRQRLLQARLAALPESDREPARKAIEIPADKRDAKQQELAARYGPALEIKPEEIAAATSDQEKADLAEIDRQRDELSRPKYQTIQVVYEPHAPPPTYVLRRGDYLSPGLEVPPALLSILRDNGAEGRLDATAAGLSSGRRLALARQLTDAEALAGQYVARVFVNRLWQQVFGRGMVASSDNFGVTGTPPTHPELLDWVTLQFFDGGRRVKPLVKMLVMSSTYRQQSEVPLTIGPPDAEEGPRRAEIVDPPNELLWRMRLRRLDSELVRDAILAVSGKLDPAVGGPPLLLDAQPNGMVVIKQDALPTPEAQWRRSLYVLARRNYHLTMLDVFDQPAVATNCTFRQPAPVVTQSLTLLHDDFVIEQARFFAERVTALTEGESPDAQVAMAFRLALGRRPDEDERTWCLDFLEQHCHRYEKQNLPADEAWGKALTHLCHMLLNTSEFLYVR